MVTVVYIKGKTNICQGHKLANIIIWMANQFLDAFLSHSKLYLGYFFLFLTLSTTVCFWSLLSYFLSLKKLEIYFISTLSQYSQDWLYIDKTDVIYRRNFGMNTDAWNTSTNIGSLMPGSVFFFFCQTNAPLKFWNIQLNSVILSSFCLSLGSKQKCRWTGFSQDA